MTDVIAFDERLVARSVNFHGHQLLKLLVAGNVAEMHNMRLQDIDYKVYQNRVMILSRLGSRTKEILEFIACKSRDLLVKRPQDLPFLSIENSFFIDRGNFQYPIECLLRIPKEIRLAQLLKTIEIGDLLLTMIHQRTGYGYSLKIVAFGAQKHQYFSDLQQSDIQIFMSGSHVDKNSKSSSLDYINGTRLKVEVLSVDRLSHIVEVGTCGVSLHGKNKGQTLGKIKIADIPAVLSSVPNPKIKYLSQCVENMETYKNPKSIEYLAKQFNISLSAYPSLMTSLRHPYKKEDMAPFLRKTQLGKWAHHYVVDGVSHFKNGKHEQAFQCLNKALSIDPQNEEAFVAKGALLANLSHYEKAVEEFEKALKSNPDNTNAKKYICETLVELGKQHKEKKNYPAAEKTFVQCLALDRNHAGAKEELQDLVKTNNTTNTLNALVTEVQADDDKNLISDLMEIEKEFKQKKELAKAKATLRNTAPEHDQTPPIKPVPTQSPAPPPTAWAPPQPSFMGYSQPSSSTPIVWGYPIAPTQNFGAGVQVVRDPSYDAKVDAFLKQCEAKNPNPVPPKLKTTEKHKGHKKRKSRSVSSSSDSDSTSSDSDHERRRKRRHKTRGHHKSRRSRSRDRRKHSKRSKDTKRKSPKKKFKKTMVEDKNSSPKSPQPIEKVEEPKTLEPETESFDPLEDLQKKLDQYYQKFGAISDKSAASDSPAPNTEKECTTPSKPTPCVEAPTAPVKDSNAVETSSLQNSVHPAFRDELETLTSAKKVHVKPVGARAKMNIHLMMSQELTKRQDIDTKLQEIKKKFFSGDDSGSSSKSPDYSESHRKKVAARAPPPSDTRRARSRSASPPRRRYNKSPPRRQYRTPSRTYRSRRSRSRSRSTGRSYRRRSRSRSPAPVSRTSASTSRHIAANKKESSSDVKPFGKWGSVGSTTAVGGSRSTSPAVPDSTTSCGAKSRASLQEYEQFLKVANTRRLDIIKERNKKLLKPPAD